MTYVVTNYDERVLRAKSHVGLASVKQMSPTDKLASAIADLRAWAHEEGVSFSEAVEVGRQAFIHSRVTKGAS